MALKKTVFPLYAAKDEPQVRPILDALSEKDFPVSAKPDRRGAVLLFLSDRLSDEPQLSETFFRLDAKGFEIVPVNLDGTKPPELIENALYSRNTIFAERYSTEELVNRIVSAKPLQAKKSRLPLVLALGAAALLVVAAVVLILKLLPAKETAAEIPTPAPIAAATAVPTAEPAAIPEIPGVDPATILEVVFVGDEFAYYAEDGESRRFGYQMKGEEEIAYRSWENNRAQYYSKEDGHEIPYAVLGDLSYLGSLPNLRYVTFVNVGLSLPDLSGITHLDRVRIYDCSVSELDGLTGSSINGFEYMGATVADFSPLSRCASLSWASIALHGTPSADFSGFCPPALKGLTLINAHFRSIDLTALSGCKDLEYLNLDDVPVNALSFLSGCTALRELQLKNLTLHDLGGIETLKELRQIHLDSVNGLVSIDAIGGCSALETFGMDGYSRNSSVRDVSVLATLPKLKSISLHTSNIRDLNFLNDLTIKDGIDLAFSSDIDDYSGLAAINSFTRLHVNTNGRSYNALVAPYLENAFIINLDLYDCGDVDLSTLPKASTLRIAYGRITSLEGLSMTPTHLELEHCQNLTTLDGLQNIGNLKNGTLTLSIDSCPRLSDWSALDGARLMQLELFNTFSLPDFSAFNASEYRLSFIDEELLPDLTCFDGLDETGFHSFDLSNQQNISDLTPLFRLAGDYLIVPPQVEEQAKELVNSRRYRSYRIGYPDGSWSPNDASFTLLSLDELNTLPKSTLRHVNALCVAGDIAFDQDHFWIERDWETNPPKLYLRENGSDESARIPIETGTVITDLSVLQDLTGLKELTLYMQPIESLEGIQYLSSLESLIVNNCHALSDASAAFALPDLYRVDLDDTSVSSIMGIQNLRALTFLSLSDTNVKDLSPLGAVDWSHLSESGNGLWLELPWQTDAAQFAALSGIPRFSYIRVGGVKYEVWGEILRDAQIIELDCSNDGFSNETFRAYCDEHPETERLYISWNKHLTDISPALSLPNLRYLQVSENMQKAIASLGEDCGIELRID